MRRRDFIKVIAGSAAAWPLAAHAQQPERMPRINVLLPATADNPDFQARLGVESHVGQGSTFAFTLPVVVERQVEPA
jgi:putative ABC transport system substrate-binding protein